jgi:hypothetical protein
LSKNSDERLSPDEVGKMLRRARQYFAASGFIAGSPTHAFEDFQELKLISHEEQENVLGRVLEEISPADYRGPHPPDHISGEPKCKGARMVQFSWNSVCFRKKAMYVKFCLKNDRFVLLRIHADYYKRKI